METPRRLCTLVRPDPTFKEQNSGLNLGMNIGMNIGYFESVLNWLICYR